MTNSQTIIIQEKILEFAATVWPPPITQGQGADEETAGLPSSSSSPAWIHHP